MPVISGPEALIWDEDHSETFDSGQIYAVSHMTGSVCCLMLACEQALPVQK